jgi:predicted nucleic acid-binding protein
MTYLLDSSVIIDAINGRNGRNELLEKFSEQDVLLACCSINVTELYMGMRPGEEKQTEQFLRSLEFYPVTWEIARLAGRLYNDWRRKGHTLSLSDVTVAAVALTNGLALLTDNREHYPMPELQLLSLPGNTE